MGNKLIEWLSSLTTSKVEINPDILMLNFRVVNSFIIGDSNNWVLVDTGLENSANYIIKTAEKRFGKNSIPKAIILTHGHFDHIGSLIKLSKYWSVPVYAHELEIPYITGEKDYPLANPSVDNGIVAKISPTFPHTSINVSNAKSLPSNGNIPYLKDWKWIFTPGHSDGHISLYREKDGTLIVGDAFCTLKQESFVSVMVQNEEISGPPKYLTIDWDKAEESVKKLQSLHPKLVLPSHGKPLYGKEANKFLTDLVKNFKDIALPYKNN